MRVYYFVYVRKILEPEVLYQNNVESEILYSIKYFCISRTRSSISNNIFFMDHSMIGHQYHVLSCFEILWDGIRSR